jgi:hypothetical protein
MKTQLQDSLNEALTILKNIHTELQSNPEEIISHMNDEDWHASTCKLVTEICYAGKDIAETVLSSIDASRTVENLFKGKLGD